MFQNILVPVDIDDPVNAERATAHARLLANASGGKVHLLYVRFHLPKTYAGFLPAGFDAREREDCIAKLEQWKEKLGLPEDRVTLTLRRGSISAEVLDEARTRNADLIIIGSHLPSLSSRIIGSNAASVIRDATVSVLVVRAEDREAI